MKSKEEFQARFRFHVMGIIAFGSGEYRRSLASAVSTAHTHGEVMANINDTANKLLGDLYDYLAAPEMPKTPGK